MDPQPPNAPISAAQREQEEEQADQEREQRAYRKARRKARDAAGEIKELNITAMMDLMTILLVFLLKSYSASTINITASEQLQIPYSTATGKPQENISIMITGAEITVNQSPATKIVSGLIPAEFREGNDANSPMVTPLYAMLSNEVEKQKQIAKYNPSAPFLGRVNIVADKRIPYQTILAVLYTAGQAELGEYKLMAAKNE